MGGSNFNHTVITSDGAALLRRSKEENKKIVFVKAVSSLKFENLRGDLVHKSIDWFESIEGSITAVQAVDGVFKMAAQFSQAPSTVTLKSIGVLAKLQGESDSEAVLFSAASDDNSQLIVDSSRAVVAFVQDLPATLNASNVDSYGTIPQGGGGGGGDLSNYVTKAELASDLEGCVASGEYDSVNHNILLKNADGDTLSTIDATDFIKDGMIDNVEIVNNNLIITFNTDSGKETITIPLTSIFDPDDYYTKAECDSTFLTSSDLSTYALKSELPTATSDLTNDSGFITSNDLSTYALKSEIPTATSDLTNDSGFITSSDLSTYALKSEIPTATSDLNNDSGFITSSDLSTYALKSEIPTDNSELTNGAGYITSSDLSTYALKSELPTATSDLTNDSGFITSSDITNMATTNTTQIFTAGKSYSLNSGSLSFPFSTQPLKLELANNNADAVFTKGDGSTVTIALSGGGSGNYVTTDTAQTITGAKTFTIPANAQAPICVIDSTGVHSDLFDGKFIVNGSAYSFGVAGSKGVDTSIGASPSNDLPTSLAVTTWVGNQGYLTSSDLSTYALKSEIPTATSDLTNDSGFLTSADLSTYALKSEIPTDNSELTNGAGYITSSALSGYALSSEIPTAVSELTNDSGYLTSADLSGYALISSLGNAAYKGVDTSIGSNPTNDNLPTSLAVKTWVDNQGFLTSHQSLAGCVASGEYDSTNHNILLKNSSGTVLSTIDASAFIKDGMVDTVTISNNNLVITFNTDAGKQPISISLASIFDPSNYYTKSQVDSGFVTTNTNQTTLTGNKAWSHTSTTASDSIEEKAFVTGGATPSMGVELNGTDTTYEDVSQHKEAKLGLGTLSIQSNSYSYDDDPVDEGEYYEASHSTKSIEANAATPQIRIHTEDYSHTYDGESWAETTDGYTATLDKEGLSFGANIESEDTTDSIALEYQGGLSIVHSNPQYDDGAEIYPNDYEIRLNNEGLNIELEQDSYKYVKVSVENGLEIQNGSNHVYTRVNDLGIQRAGRLYMWSDIPLEFSGNFNAYSVQTYGSSASIEYVPKHFITQVHFKDDNGTFKCATQANRFSGSGQSWTSYLGVTSAVVNIADSTLKFVFNASDKLERVRITTPATHGTMCNFKILVPQSSGYAIVQGTIYADASSTADYILSTPLEFDDGDLVVVDAQFTPTFFIPVPNNA